MILDRDEVPEERQVARLLKQILDGIAFLHSLNVAHLDIKVSVFKHLNYVYGEGGPNSDRLTKVWPFPKLYTYRDTKDISIHGSACLNDFSPRKEKYII